MLHIQAPHNSNINTTTNLLLFRCSVVSNPLWSHGLQASLSFIISQNLLKLMSCRCHPTIPSSVRPSPPDLNLSQHQGFFPMSQPFTADGQSIGASTSVSVLPMNEYSRLISFSIDWFDLLAVQGALRVAVQNHQFLGTQPSLWSNLTSVHDYWKNHSFD